MQGFLAKVLVLILFYAKGILGAEYYCLQHYGGRYLTVTDSQVIRLTSTCKSLFTHLGNNAFQLANSDLCMEPDNTNNNAWNRMKNGCGKNAEFVLSSKGSLKHVTTGKCLHPSGGHPYPSDGTLVVLHSGCDVDRLKFQLVQKHYCIQHYSGLHFTVSWNGYSILLTRGCTSVFTILPNNALRLANSMLCLEPENTNNNAKIVVKEGCGSNAKMTLTAKYSIQHFNTKKCIHPQGGSLSPALRTQTVLHSGCDESRLQFKLVDENLALGKPTIQSGTGWGGASNYAVDGNLNPDYGGKSCTAAPAIKNTWWRVDLLSQQTVCMVKVTNRADCCPERLNNFEVWVGNNGAGSGSGAGNSLCGSVGVIGGGETKTVICAGSFTGRYVFVRLKGTNILTVCEVQVFGSCTCAPRSGLLENLALKKPTTQIDAVYNSGNAVDGNLNPNFHDGSCTHTTLRVNPWWRVDLQKDQSVCMVTVTNREDCCNERLYNFEVWIGNNGGGDGTVGNTLCNTVSRIGLGEIKTVLCQKTISGRYLFIRLPRKDYLTLCEVQVYGPTTLPFTCPDLKPPKQGMLVHGKSVALSLCKWGTFPSTKTSSYYVCDNGVWKDQDGITAGDIPDCTGSAPPPGIPRDVYKHWTFQADCNSDLAKANAKSKLLYLGICHKGSGCTDLQIKTVCG